MNVLVIAPHPDDESIGCGGTLRLHVKRGDRVLPVFLTSGEQGLKALPQQEAWKIREAEARKACSILGIEAPLFLRFPDSTLGQHVAAPAAGLLTILTDLAPQLAYVPHSADSHPDHHAASRILALAVEKAGFKALKVRGYEVWTPMAFFDEIEEIDSVMPRKISAIRAHRSQLTQLAYHRAITGLNAYRGAIAGRSRYAEAFQVIQWPGQS